MAECTTEENIDIMIQVMSDVGLRVSACAGYTITGASNTFEGIDDDKIKIGAEEFWTEMGMRNSSRRRGPGCGEEIPRRGLALDIPGDIE